MSFECSYGFRTVSFRLLIIKRCFKITESFGKMYNKSRITHERNIIIKMFISENLRYQIYGLLSRTNLILNRAGMEGGCPCVLVEVGPGLLRDRIRRGCLQLVDPFYPSGKKDLNMKL